MNYLGDFPVGGMVDFKWSTNGADGASITRATNGTVSVYFGNDVGQITDGVTDTEDFDSVTGIHHCRIDLTQSSDYAAGIEYQVVLSGATLDGVNPVNAVLAHFSIERSGGVLALLKGANGLSAIKTETASIQTDTNDIQARLPAALVSGRMDSSVGAMAANVLTASALATDAVDEITAEVWAESARTLTAIDEDSTTLDLDATIRSAVGLAAANLDTQLDALPTSAENATAVWGAGARTLTALDEDNTTLDLDATIRAAVGLSSANLDTQLTAIDDAVDTEVGAIKAVTDKLDTTLELGDTDGNYQFTTLSLENAPTGGSAPTVGQIADEVQTRTIAAVTVVNGLAANVITAAATAPDFTTEIQAGLATQASVDDLPTNAELATALAAADDAVLAAVATVDTVVDAIKVTTDKLDGMVENTSDGWIWTVASLQNAPSGTGASPSAIADEVQTRTIAAVTMVNGLAANTVNASALAADAVTEIQSGLATASAVDDLPTNAELATALGTADDAVLAAIAALPTAVQNADALLDRNMATGTDSGSTTVRTPRQALRILRNKWTIDSDGEQTIMKEDDSTPSWTQQLATDSAAAPVTGTDPAGP